MPINYLSLLPGKLITSIIYDYYVRKLTDIYSYSKLFMINNSGNAKVSKNKSVKPKNYYLKRIKAIINKEI